jgi:hypothetical protein
LHVDDRRNLEMTTQSTVIEPARSNGRRSSQPTAVDQARAVVLRVGDALPPAIAATRELVAGSLRAIDVASDERISAGTTLSLGLAIGLLISGAPRLFAVAALVPVAAMGLALIDRRPRAGRSVSAG